MNFATLLVLIQKGRVTPRSVIRGPTTSQFWRHAARVRGVSREFGVCWNCGQDVNQAARTCPNCRRSQEPPTDADALLETAPDGGAEDLTEKIWAEDAGAVAGQSPVEQLTARGGVRREIPAGALRRQPDPSDVIAEGPPPKAPSPATPSHADAREARILRREAATRAAAPRPVPRREASPRAAPVGMGVGYDDGLDDYHLPSDRRRGGFFRKLAKVLFVALLLGSMGIGALIYLDPDGAGRRFRDYSHRAWAWTKAKYDHIRSGRAATPSSRPDSSTPADAREQPQPSTQSATASTDDFSRLSPQQAKYKVYELWDAGEAASMRGEHQKAVTLWESIKRLPGIKEDDWPLGLNARIDLAKKKIK
jgi:hypothetical protein